MEASTERINKRMDGQTNKRSVGRNVRLIYQEMTQKLIKYNKITMQN